MTIYRKNSDYRERWIRDNEDWKIVSFRVQTNVIYIVKKNGQMSNFVFNMKLNSLKSNILIPFLILKIY